MIVWTATPEQFQEGLLKTLRHKGYKRIDKGIEPLKPKMNSYTAFEIGVCAMTWTNNCEQSREPSKQQKHPREWPVTWLVSCLCAAQDVPFGEELGNLNGRESSFLEAVKLFIWGLRRQEAALSSWLSELRDAADSSRLEKRDGL